jgi:hypothetical protein
VYGNIEDLALCSDIKVISISHGKSIEGNINALKGCTSITTLEIANTNIHGSLNTLFDAWATSGKNGDVLLSFSGTQCSLSGVTTYADNRVTFSGNSWSVSKW